jgi:hypothetical protein
MKFLFAQGVKNFVVIEFDINGLLFATINDGWDAARTAQAAARTRSLYAAWGCIKLHEKLQKGWISPG